MNNFYSKVETTFSLQADIMMGKNSPQRENLERFNAAFKELGWKHSRNPKYEDFCSAFRNQYGCI